MASQNGGGIAGSLILAVAILAGGFLVARSLDGVTDEISTLALAVAEVKQAVGSPAARPAPTRARRGPDPDRVYSIQTVGAPAVGPEDARVTVVEFSDFQCPFCARVKPTMDQIKKAYPDRVRIVFKHLPLSIHPQAPGAHAAAAAAHRQGKFWEMHDRIFDNQRELAPETFEGYAGELGLDLERFRADVASAQVKEQVDQDVSEARKLGVSGTPSFFVNGRFLSGAQPFEKFKVLIDRELES